MVVFRESREASRLLREALQELEDSKGRAAPAVRKIRRAASLVDDLDLVRWCRIQLGDVDLTAPIQQVLDEGLRKTGEKEVTLTVTPEHLAKLEAAGINFSKDVTPGEVTAKAAEAGGGWRNIEYLEEMRETLLRLRQASSGELYVGNLSNTIGFVRTEAHARATALYHELEFADSLATAFDVLKEEVDDKLIALAPELGEKLMLAFEHVSAGGTPEHWAEGLTSCRRLLKDLADKLYPPSSQTVDGRKLGEEQYVNRLWAFMDDSIASKSNRALAKAHVDLVGSHLQHTVTMAHKGVHAEVSRLEAVRTALHTYLVIADVLAYLDRSTITGGPPLPNIHTVKRDQIVSLIGVKEEIANAIIKLRAKTDQVTLADLRKVKGIGPKTLERIQERLSLDYPPPGT